MRHRSNLLDVLRAGALVRSGGVRQIVELKGETLWWVETGHIDLFWVVAGSRADGIGRRHLVRIPTGRAALTFQAGDAAHRYILVAVGTGVTRLRKVPIRWLRGAAGAGAPAELASLIDGWIDLLYLGLARDLVPPRTLELGPGRELTLPAAGVYRGTEAVCWLHHLSGSSTLFGREGLHLAAGTPAPLSRRSWLVTREPCEVRVERTADILAEGRVWPALAALQELARDCAAHLLEEAGQRERDRLIRRSAAERLAMKKACDRLEGIRQDHDETVAGDLSAIGSGSAILESEERLFRACELVGRDLDLPIRRPAPGTADTIDLLEAIGRASGFRARRVLLRSTWWRDYNGPLLGLVEEGRRPVPLIGKDGGGYQLLDPGGSASCAVDTTVAETLHPFAYTFYRPFPAGRLKLLNVLAFGLFGCRRDLVALILTGLAGGLLGALVPVTTGIVFSSVIPGAQHAQLLQITLLLLASAVAMALFQLVRSVALIRIEGRMAAATQAAVWDRLLSLPLSFFRSYTAGDLATRAMGIDTIRQILSGATMTALLGGGFSVIYLGLLFYYSRALALWALVIVAAAAGVTVGLGWLQLRAQRRASYLQRQISGLVLQLLGSVAKLRVAGAEIKAFAQWAERFSAQRKAQFRARRYANLLAAFNAALPLVALLVIFTSMVSLQARGGGLSTGDFLAFSAAFAALLSASLAASGALVSALDAVPLYEGARPILESEPEGAEGRAAPGRLSGEIELQHITFRYEAGGNPVLNDFSLRIGAGEFVALVGPSGSGKSTLLRLLLGFERAESGSIYLDGQELSGLDLQAVRRQYGVVLQTGRLIPGDIFTNIVGSTVATLEEAWEAARLAGLEDDIRRMPMGMHTAVSEGGSTLSGGQRQRLQIARAIVNRPRILLFDEATSALDNRTQALVSASLEGLQATRLVIAHRLSTIVNADRIVVLEAGRVVQAGRYLDLQQQGGAFAKLAQRQIL